MKDTSLSDCVHYLFEKGIYDYQDMNTEDKDILTGYLLIDDNVDNQIDFIREAPEVGNNFENSLIYRMAQYLIHQDKDTAFDLLEEVKKTGANFYKDKIQNLLDKEVVENWPVMVQRHPEILEQQYDSQRSL